MEYLLSTLCHQFATQFLIQLRLAVLDYCSFLNSMCDCGQQPECYSVVHLFVILFRLVCLLSTVMVLERLEMSCSTFMHKYVGIILCADWKKVMWSRLVGKSDFFSIRNGQSKLNYLFQVLKANYPCSSCQRMPSSYYL